MTYMIESEGTGIDQRPPGHAGRCYWAAGVNRPQWINPIQPSVAAPTIQIATMVIAAALLRGRVAASSATARYSAMTSSGINDSTSQTPNGTMITSST